MPLVGRPSLARRARPASRAQPTGDIGVSIAAASARDRLDLFSRAFGLSRREAEVVLEVVVPEPREHAPSDEEGRRPMARALLRARQLPADASKSVKRVLHLCSTPIPSIDEVEVPTRKRGPPGSLHP